MSNVRQLDEIPDELAAEAAQVPGLSKRLLDFLRAEVSQHRRRQSRYSAESQQPAQASSDQACALKAAGMKPEQARAQFAKLYAEVMNDIPGYPSDADDTVFLLAALNGNASHLVT